MVVATQNPIEQQGTYPLPEAQLDRFLFKHRDRLSGRDEEQRHRRRSTATAGIMPSLAELGIAADRRPGRASAHAGAAVAAIRLSDEIIDYVVDLIRATREHPVAAVRRLAARRQHAGHGGPRLRRARRAATSSSPTT